MLWNLERSDYVGCRRKLREVVAANSVPVAVTVGPSLVLRHICQHAHIAGRTLHQVVVVLHRCGNEQIIFRVLVLFRVVWIDLVLLVDEQSLDPPMPDTTQFVTLQAFYPVVLIVSYEVGVHHQLYAAGHSWRDYIYSPSTLYDVLKPCAIFRIITVFKH